MRILITYASAGTGHKHSAEALFKFIKNHHKDIDVEIADILSFTTVIFNFFYSFGYNFVAKNTPKLWGFFYKISGSSTSLALSNRIRFFINRINGSKFEKFIERKNFDVIVSTHFFPSEVAGFLKEQGKIKSSIISIITDFAVHPFWINNQVDKFIVALSETKNDLIREGIAADKIKILGIPIDEAFFISKDRKELSSRIGIDPNKFTILVVIGSIGTGPIEKIIDTLNHGIQILVVCGRNIRLHKELKSKKTPGMLVFGFVHNMADLMSVSDLIITKAGGITIVESITKDLTPIFIPIIGGQEFYNAEILFKHKACFIVRNIRELKDAVFSCKDDPLVIGGIKKQLEQIKKPNVLNDITDEIRSSYTRATS